VFNSVDPISGSISQTISQSRPASNSPTDHIISILNIPDHLVNRTAHGLHTSYAKYLAYLDAQKALAKAVNNGEWKLAKKHIGENLIEVFISKSTFFKNYQPFFPRVPNHPALHLWLINGDDAPTNLEAWGFQKNIYSFKDLEMYFDDVDKKERAKGKGKGKGKEEAKASGSGGGKSEKSKTKKRA
jgi:hypothetical protein